VVYISILAIVYLLDILGKILKQPVGSASMNKISKMIKEGSEGFLQAQYVSIYKLSLVFTIAIGLSVWHRDNSPQLAQLGNPFGNMA
jgi:Na+/H+-translocating membrane pyrophosphatase